MDSGPDLAEHLFELINNESAGAESMAIYDAAVERLTAEGWRRG